jgi:hypothetical protein
MMKSEVGEKVWDQLQNIDKKNRVDYSTANKMNRGGSGGIFSKGENIS